MDAVKILRSKRGAQKWTRKIGLWRAKCHVLTAKSHVLTATHRKCTREIGNGGPHARTHVCTRGRSIVILFYITPKQILAILLEAKVVVPANVQHIPPGLVKKQDSSFKNWDVSRTSDKSTPRYRIKQDSSLRTNSTWQVDTNMVLLQTKYKFTCTYNPACILCHITKHLHSFIILEGMDSVDTIFFVPSIQQILTVWMNK